LYRTFSSLHDMASPLCLQTSPFVRAEDKSFAVGVYKLTALSENIKPDIWRKHNGVEDGEVDLPFLIIVSISLQTPPTLDELQEVAETVTDLHPGSLFFSGEPATPYICGSDGVWYTVAARSAHPAASEPNSYYYDVTMQGWTTKGMKGSAYRDGESPTVALLSVRSSTNIFFVL
jgi:hypothetical protein